MALAQTGNVILGSIAFVIFWVLAVFPAVPFLPIGRTAGALLGAMLMIVFKIITPEEAFAAIDLSVLGLLFGTMVVSFYLERAGMFKYLGILLSWRSYGAKDLLCRICVVSAIASALFTNDTTCVVLTEFILKIARQNGVSPHPFLLALASSANVGSSATPIGNPQNLVIALQSGISFGDFVLGIIPAMLVGVLVNIGIIVCMYWRVLTVKKDEEKDLEEAISIEDDTLHRFSPVAMSHTTVQAFSPKLDTLNSPETFNSPMGKRKPRRSLSESDMYRGSDGKIECTKKSVGAKGKSDDEDDAFSQIMDEMIAKGSMEMMNDAELGMAPQSQEKKEKPKKWKKLSWKTCIYLVIIGMLIALLMGLNMAWTALTAALVLVVLDFKDAGPCLEKVSYSLLIFFCGMFITVEGFNKTGIPSTLWNIMEPHARINNVSGIAVLAVVILVLSNVASNVPTVLLLGARVAASAAAVSKSDEKRAWLILAYVSTIAGNLSLLGSAANLIVCEQARRAQPVGYTLTFWTHIKFGFPSTLIITAIGLLLIRG